MGWSAPFTDVVMAKQGGKQSACGGLTTIIIQSGEMHAGEEVGRLGKKRKREGGKGSQDQRPIS